MQFYNPFQTHAGHKKHQPLLTYFKYRCEFFISFYFSIFDFMVKRFWRSPIADLNIIITRCFFNLLLIDLQRNSEESS